MINVRVVDASTPASAGPAVDLMFAYLAETQREAGRPVPTRIADLPAVLRTECEHLLDVYRSPGAVLLADSGSTPVGCVGLRDRDSGLAEIKRLYVRPGERSRGVGRLLMEHAHALARKRGFRRVVLDVMPSRVAAIELYRRLGYRHVGEDASGMVQLECRLQGGVTEDADWLDALPASFWTVPYVYERGPDAVGTADLSAGANCQLFAYSVLAHFGRRVPPARSSELWADPNTPVVGTDYQPLDLILFNETDRAYAAHVGVYVDPDRILHLCHEVGTPTVWAFADFGRRRRYRVVVGAKRFPRVQSSRAREGFGA